MNQADVITLLVCVIPFMFCGGLWVGVRIAREQARIDAEIGQGIPHTVSHPKARNTFAPTPHSPNDE